MITRRIARPLSALSSGNWVCPSCTRSSLFRQHTQQKRNLAVPALGGGSYDETFARDGVPGLLSRIGFRLAWTDYQKSMVSKLNSLLAEDASQDMSPKDLAIQYARDPMNASLFNHASMAFNNHFFFQGFAPSPQELDKCPGLKAQLEASFGSIDTLRTTMLDTASAMFGPGFVWLVWIKPPTDTGAVTASSEGSFRILTTYIAGTPFPEAGYQQRGLDMATNNADSFSEYQQSQIRPANTLGSFGKYSAHGKEKAKYPPGGTQVTPLLCVNTWEHVWIYDFGLGGKRRYLSDWWDAIDWHTVETNLPTQARTREFQRDARTYGSAA